MGLIGGLVQTKITEHHEHGWQSHLVDMVSDKPVHIVLVLFGLVAVFLIIREIKK